MITAAVGILGAGAVSAAEFEAAELYVPAVGLKQSAQWIDEEKFQAELTLEVTGLRHLREIKITINRRNAGFFMSNFIYFYVVWSCILSLYVI